jgi:hypothetical protein
MAEILSIGQPIIRRASYREYIERLRTSGLVENNSQTIADRLYPKLHSEHDGPIYPGTNSS